MLTQTEVKRFDPSLIGPMIGGTPTVGNQNGARLKVDDVAIAGFEHGVPVSAPRSVDLGFDVVTGQTC